MKIAVVVGGSGFLGSHVSDELTKAGYLVKVVDRRPSSWIKQQQEMIVTDLINEGELGAAMKDASVVFNFAALSDLNEALRKPVETAQINVMGNLNVLEACRRAGVERFVYASSVYVSSRYGGFYRCSKQAAESFVQEYQKTYDLQYTILRYGSLYGPRADVTNGLYRIVRRALETGRVSYEGSREALREYIHVEDAARASVTALGDEFVNQSVVLTGQEPMKVLDMLEMLSEILDCKRAVEFDEIEPVGHYKRTPYSYESNLGRKFIPPMHVDLGQGLLQLIHYIQNEVHGD